jgi:hypothetical protein
MSDRSTTERPATRVEISDMLGDLDDATLLEIMATQASPREVEEAAMWLAGEDDVMGDLRKPLDGRAAAVYQILIAREAVDDEP